MATTKQFSGMSWALVLVLCGCATAFEEGESGRGHDALSGEDAAACADREARGEPCEAPTDPAGPAAGSATDDTDRPAPTADTTDPGVAPPAPLPSCAADVAPGSACAMASADRASSGACQLDDGTVCSCGSSADAADATTRWTCVAPAPEPAPIACGREVVTGAICTDDGVRSCGRSDGSRCDCVEAATGDGTLVWRCEDPPPPPLPLMCPPDVHPGSTTRVECREPHSYCNVGDFWCECVEDDLRDPPFPVYYWACPTPPPPPMAMCPPGVFPGSERDVSCEPERDRTCSVDGASCRCTEDTRRAGPLPVFHWVCEDDGSVPVPAAAD